MLWSDLIQISDQIRSDRWFPDFRKNTYTSTTVTIKCPMFLGWVRLPVFQFQCSDQTKWSLIHTTVSTSKRSATVPRSRPGTPRHCWPSETLSWRPNCQWTIHSITFDHIPTVWLCYLSIDRVELWLDLSFLKVLILFNFLYVVIIIFNFFAFFG